MLSLLLLATDAPEPVVWRWASGVATAIFLAAGLRTLAQFIRFPTAELRNAGASRAVFHGGAVMGFAICALQIYNLATAAKFWPFLTAIVASLLSATLQFAILVLNRPVRR
jgi:hypothetical protein